MGNPWISMLGVVIGSVLFSVGIIYFAPLIGLGALIVAYTLVAPFWYPKAAEAANPAPQRPH